MRVVLPNVAGQRRRAESRRHEGVGCLLRLIHVSWWFRVGMIVSPSLAHLLQFGRSRPEVKVSIMLTQFHDFEHASPQPVFGSIGPMSNHLLDLARGQ